MPANGRQHGRCPADSQGKMLAPRNGGIRLCRHRGANSDGERLRSRQNVGASQRRHKALPAMGRQLGRRPGRTSGQNVGASQRRHKALPAMGRQLGRCPADSQGKMLAPRNGDTWLCRQWGANSGARAGADLVHEPPQNLVLSFPLHQVFKPFQCSAGTDLVHKSPQNLVLSFPLHQISGPFQRSAGADLVHRPPQDPVLSSSLHQVSGPFQRSAGNGATTRPAADYRPAP